MRTAWRRNYHLTIWHGVDTNTHRHFWTKYRSSPRSLFRHASPIWTSYVLRKIVHLVLRLPAHSFDQFPNLARTPLHWFNILPDLTIYLSLRTGNESVFQITEQQIYFALISFHRFQIPRIIDMDRVSPGCCDLYLVPTNHHKVFWHLRIVSNLYAKSCAVLAWYMDGDAVDVSADSTCSTGTYVPVAKGVRFGAYKVPVGRSFYLTHDRSWSGNSPSTTNVICDLGWWRWSCVFYSTISVYYLCKEHFVGDSFGTRQCRVCKETIDVKERRRWVKLGGTPCNRSGERARGTGNHPPPLVSYLVVNKGDKVLALSRTIDLFYRQTLCQ